MSLIIENMSYVIMFAVLILICILYIIHFSKLSKEERYEQIRGWLLQAVIMAEKQFGSGTGILKLSSVYTEFCKQMPWLAEIVPFSSFSSYVDEALAEMKNLIKDNSAIASVVESKGED